MAKRRAGGRVTDGNAVAQEKALEKAGWEAVGGGTVFKWAPGKALLGRYVRMKPGNVATLLVIDTDAGAVTAGCPTILKSRMEDCRPGDNVYIRCTGKIEVAGSSKGNDAWDFVVLRKRGSGPGKQLVLDETEE